MLAVVGLWLVVALRLADTASAAEAAAAAVQRLGSCEGVSHEQCMEADAQRPSVGSCAIVPSALMHLPNQAH
jgi:hypothetical protein